MRGRGKSEFGNEWRGNFTLIEKKKVKAISGYHRYRYRWSYGRLRDAGKFFPCTKTPISTFEGFNIFGSEKGKVNFLLIKLRG